MCDLSDFDIDNLPEINATEEPPEWAAKDGVLQEWEALAKLRGNMLTLLSNNPKGLGKRDVRISKVAILEVLGKDPSALSKGVKKYESFLDELDTVNRQLEGIRVGALRINGGSSGAQKNRRSKMTKAQLALSKESLKRQLNKANRLNVSTLLKDELSGGQKELVSKVKKLAEKNVALVDRNDNLENLNTQLIRDKTELIAEREKHLSEISMLNRLLNTTRDPSI